MSLKVNAVVDDPRSKLAVAVSLIPGGTVLSLPLVDGVSTTKKAKSVPGVGIVEKNVKVVDVNPE